MRIGLYGPPSVSTERTGTGVAPVTVPAAEAVPVDKATLSSGSLSLPALTAQALEAAGLRSAKVEALSKAVNSGTYQLDPGVIAHALTSSKV